MRIRTILLMLVTAIACTGCPSDLPNTLEERVQLRWDALLAGDIDTAYRLLSPGFREAVSQDLYSSRLSARTVRWTGTKFVEVASCEGEVCTVKVDVGYAVRAAVPGVSTYEGSRRGEERWIRVGGAWYFVPDRLE